MSRKQADQIAINETETPDADSEVEQVTEFFLHFPTEWDAYVTQSCLMNLQFDTTIERSESTDNWVCVAQKKIKPSSDRLLELKNFFERLAAGNNGSYDGWGTTVEVDGKKTENGV